MARHTAAVGATLTACALALVAMPSPVAAATAQTTQANAALRYLYTQVKPDGSIEETLGATEDTVISDAVNGYDPATLKNSTTGTSAYAYLSAKASTITTAGGAAKFVLAWIAAGKPSQLDGTAQLTKLNTPVAAGGYLEPNGAFHNAKPSVERANAYSQSLAVIADVAAGVTLPPNATGWLTCAQRTDGGFGYSIRDSAPAPPASCGATSSDTNDTGMILQALGAARLGSADAAAVAYLHTQETAGGFGFDSSSATDPDSDAVVIQGLLAIGQDPTATAWTAGNGTNPMTSMESFADPANGGYSYTTGTAPDAFTTSPVPQALALAPYGTVRSIVPGSVPPPPVTTTPSPSPTASPAPIAVPATGGGGGMAAAAWGLALLAVGMVALGFARRVGRAPSAP